MVNTVIIFGNSGSGKSTLAQHLKQQHKLAHLDLDTLAWEATEPPTRRAQEASIQDIHAFIKQHPRWVIEGCYAGLLSFIAPLAEQAVIMDLPVTRCQENARNRPWEPHKYPSKADQDAFLEALLDWVREYETREDEFSLKAHRQLFDSFNGDKIELKTNEEAAKFREEWGEISD